MGAIARRHLHRRARYGCGKIAFLIAEHGEAVSVMRAIKTAIDPDNIMNPEKFSRSRLHGLLLDPAACFICWRR